MLLLALNLLGINTLLRVKVESGSLKRTTWTVWSPTRCSRARPSNSPESTITRSTTSQGLKLSPRAPKSPWKASSCSETWLRWRHLHSTTWRKTTFLRSQMNNPWVSSRASSTTTSTTDSSKANQWPYNNNNSTNTNNTLITRLKRTAMHTIMQTVQVVSPLTSSNSSQEASNKFTTLY